MSIKLFNSLKPLYRFSIRNTFKYNSDINSLRSKYKPRLLTTSTIIYKKIKTKSISKQTDAKEDANELDDIDSEYDGQYESLVSSVLRYNPLGHNCLILQPYVKWGPKKSDITPESKLVEAVALINSLPRWNVIEKLIVPLENLEKKTLFGTGKTNELQELIKNYRRNGRVITAIFVSIGTLKYTQKQFLEEAFSLPVLDRYSVVIQILKLHAISKESKLQVAMAEIPYMWSQLKDMGKSQIVGGLEESKRKLLRGREHKLKQNLIKLRAHRELLRNRRKQRDYPIVAVVGYTNAGKTSLIKALTGSDSLMPRNQLFATLDVTAHAGLLPSNLQVLYMDTVGFMSDIPTSLIECFVATLEDAMQADVIIHVQDMSHENRQQQSEHVILTLRSLLRTCPESEQLLNNIITVGNKIDLCSDIPDDCLSVSAKELTGLDTLKKQIEGAVLNATERLQLTIRVPMGASEVGWLYKEAAVTSTEADPADSQYLLLHVIITKVKLKQFKKIFC